MRFIVFIIVACVFASSCNTKPKSKREAMTIASYNILDAIAYGSYGRFERLIDIDDRIIRNQMTKHEFKVLSYTITRNKIETKVLPVDIKLNNIADVTIGSTTVNVFDGFDSTTGLESATVIMEFLFENEEIDKKPKNVFFELKYNASYREKAIKEGTLYNLDNYRVY